MKGALVACVLAGGCAKITTFEALPRYACAGEEVVLTWQIVGDAELTVEPQTPLDKQDGKAVIRPRANTRVVLVADRWFDSSKPAVQEITVTLADAKLVTAPVGDDGTCENGVLRVPVKVSQFSENVKVARVSSASDDRHSYVVEHAGRSGSVSPAAASEAFAGTQLNGDWVLAATLLPSEQCQTPTLPRNLVVQVATQCSGGQP